MWFSHAAFLVKFPGRATRALFNPVLPIHSAPEVHRGRHQHHATQLRPPSSVRTIYSSLENTRVPRIFVPVGDDKYLESMTLSKEHAHTLDYWNARYVEMLATSSALTCTQPSVPSVGVRFSGESVLRCRLP
ncbi:hypothetical protein F5146DRAFT_482763 [Armillaria mellea]|nr:hypothetical protein F5146DRAFT_482763 [Armillaria mellea]